MMKAHPDLI
jgi:hypothetical protein